MAVITLTIPDASINRIIDAFAAEFQYSATLPDGTPNPQTKAQFCKAQVIEHVKQVTRNYEGNLAADTSRTAKISEINAISIT